MNTLNKPEIIFTFPSCMGGVASFNYNIINRQNGSLVKTENIEFSGKFSKLMDVPYYSYKINSKYNKSKEFNKKEFDFKSIIAINSNSKVLDFVKSVNVEKQKNFQTEFAENGLWLSISGDKTFKVVYFKN